VYCHTNKINGKKYIGITCQEPERRWNNGNGYVNNEYFYRSIQKYGWHNFAHEILYSGISKSEAEDLEINLISEYKCSDNRYGYNIERGGNSTGKFTPEICRKISEALKGHKCSEETKAKISAAHKGRPSPKKGKKMPPEFVRKNSESHKGIRAWNKGRPWTDEERAKCNGRPVRCVETGKIYRTAHEAGRLEGIDFSSICKCVKGKKKTAGSYHWMAVEEWSVPNG
jgi:group I intron endonuclease